MAPINIDLQLAEWLEWNVFSAFEARGTAVTPAAKNIIAYAVQAQAEEQIPPHLEMALGVLQSQVGQRASAEGTFFEGAVDVFLEMYPSDSELNVNRAVRLLAEMYLRRFGGFPCGPTGRTRGGRRSGSGGRGSQATPVPERAKAGA